MKTDFVLEKFGTLRDIKPDEVELMLSWRNSPKVRKNMFTQQKIGLQDHLAWWESVKKRDSQKVLMFESNNVPLGIVSFTGIDETAAYSSWGFYTSPYAPKGTGKKMACIALDYGFSELMFQKIYGEVLAFNTTSINFHTYLGFKNDKKLVNHQKIENDYIDVFRFVLLSNEWKNKSSSLKLSVLRAD